MKPNANLILASIALVVSCFCIAMMQGAEAARDRATAASSSDVAVAKSSNER
ncbi:MAG: hypothetical protein AAGC77_08180 [Pseudomonadota bacterium]